VQRVTIGNFYGADLAHIHAAGFTALAEAAAREALERLGPDARVLEVGCGDGTTARCLADAGHDVVAIDIAPAMVQLARQRAPNATVRQGSAVDDGLPTELDAILAVSEVLSYLPPDGLPAPPLRHTLEHLVSHVAPGGFLLFDLVTPDRVPDEPYRTWTAGEGWAVLVDVRRADMLLRREIVTFREHAAGVFRRDAEIHLLAPHRRDDVLDALRQLGCTAETLPDYAGVELPAGLTAILAVKR